MAEGQQPQDPAAQVSEAQIAVHWREEEYYPPPPAFIAQANATDPAIFERFSEEQLPGLLQGVRGPADWDQHWHTMLDTSNPPFWKWFVGGKLNASYNCVDRHLRQAQEQDRDHLRARAGGRRARSTITYQELYRRVNEFAALLRDFLRREDRRPGHLPHADGARAADHDAGLRPARRHPLGGVRRVQRQGLRRTGSPTPAAAS